MKLNATTVTAAVAVLTLLITMGTGMFYLGILSNRVENLSDEVNKLREEIRRNNEQFLHLLDNHTHDADGNAIFTVPPSMEPAGANPNPNSRIPAQ